MIGATVAVTMVAALMSPPGGYDRSTLQRDLDGLRDAGLVGVKAEVDTGPREFTAVSGVADRATGKPVSHRGFFRMGSTGKTFVAVVILQLVAERKMSLDDTVERWLPGVVRGKDNDGTKISVRQLLQHTSGLHNYTNELPIFTYEEYLKHRFDQYRPEQLVAGAMRFPRDFAPGTSWKYSNTNYLLAGMIIEKVTGRGWYDQVTRRILKPLLLKDTFSPGSWPGLPYPHSKGYTKYPGTSEYVDTTLINMSWAGAVGDMITTTADMTRFWRALLGGKLLPPKQMAQMRTTVPENTPKRAYGLGIGTIELSCGGVAWGHGGNALGYAHRNGFSDDGGRGMVMIQTSRQMGGPTEPLTDQAIDRMLCATK
ncbi:serine hydrolase [Kibdelosporangium aridum]|uniref:Serine hydrolase n=1 Tax=Kibdelosporangium aridum TaxID=2030 RepID=A0A428YZY6_KIBAR|nr:serine hydrolase domain-containing protein [Kibdelosporangium aridum]RSM77307.1 serine hydrolase [Kibdelosporangium aridum]